ncbi:1694_t:CDS:2 [Funneliformis geosporum]|uniref:1694_t:CDS:1 n=1 Tax=Funneliformis geosporum TaxID=1117311 RepID=A0A9W4SY11_9GLOM|nr:1694_t:CDS:2 [Funneliformis geosporum]
MLSPESVYENAADKFSASKLIERSQFRNDYFKLNYSSILNKFNKTYRDNYKIETATESASISSITTLLQLSESEDNKDEYSKG